MWIIRLFEITRAALAFFGFWLAYSAQASSIESVNALLMLAYVPIIGVTALESLLLSNASAEFKQRESHSPYQIQSGLNNLATALVGVGVWLLNWPISAKLTVIYIALVFLFSSSLMHLKEYLWEKNQAFTCSVFCLALPRWPLPYQ